MIRVSRSLNYFLRLFYLLVTMALLIAIPAAVLGIAAQDFGAWAGLLLIGMEALAFGIWYLNFHATAIVWFSPEGVWVRVFWKKRLYPWKDIAQAGIWWNQFANYYFQNQLVLLLPGGSRRRYRDKTFLLRNPRKLLCLPPTDFNRNYVLKHYGPLDFNLTDGAQEKSIVMD